MSGLTDQERQEIDALVEHLPSPEAGGIEALAAVQRHRGWIDDDALAAVADHLGMSVAALDSVATFYNLLFRRPVGRHVIGLCDSVSCWLTGAENLWAALRERLDLAPGRTTGDDRFTLIPMPCLGCCDRAPALMVDDDLHTHLTPARLEEVLADYE